MRTDRIVAAKRKIPTPYTYHIYMEHFWKKTPHTVRVCYFHFNRGFPNGF